GAGASEGADVNVGPAVEPGTGGMILDSDAGETAAGKPRRTRATASKGASKSASGASKAPAKRAKKSATDSGD
ncbi:MAG TPA: hypothetical protein VIP46_00480, partial [Pyrinomonadaceae bacterium]